MPEAPADYGYIFDVAQLSHVELFTKNLERSVWFFHDLLGMDIVLTDGNSVYLRAYDEFQFASLKLTESATSGLGHVGWRCRSPNALQRRVTALQSSGYGIGWIDGDHGHGPAYRFTTPEGHVMELFWEVEHAAQPRSILLNRPARRPARGVPVRRIDHVNIFSRNVRDLTDFFCTMLHFQLREYIMTSHGSYTGAWLSVSNLVHELGIMEDGTGAGGRLHHVAYWYGQPMQLWEVADLFREYGIFIEGGPGRHAITQAMFLYVYEPGGRNRIELFGDVGYLIFEPDWTPICWRADELHGPYLNRPAESFFYHATPEIEKE